MPTEHPLPPTHSSSPFPDPLAHPPRTPMPVLGWVYLALAAIGLVGTAVANIAGFGGPNPFVQWFATPANTSLAIDLFVVASAASIFIIIEGRRVGVRWPWLYVVGSFVTAIAFTFPLFLAMRERQLRKVTVHHLTLTVTDKERSAAWYQAVLGPASRIERTGPGWTRVRMQWPNGLVIGVTEHEGSAGRPFDHTTTGLDHVGLDCQDEAGVRDWAARLDALGVTHGPIEVVPYGWAVTARDPDGIPLEFFALKR